MWKYTLSCEWKAILVKSFFFHFHSFRRFSSTLFENKIRAIWTSRRAKQFFSSFIGVLFSKCFFFQRLTFNKQEREGIQRAFLFFQSLLFFFFNELGNFFFISFSYQFSIGTHIILIEYIFLKKFVKYIIVFLWSWFPIWDGEDEKVFIKRATWNVIIQVHKMRIYKWVGTSNAFAYWLCAFYIAL